MGSNRKQGSGPNGIFRGREPKKGKKSLKKQSGTGGKACRTAAGILSILLVLTGFAGCRPAADFFKYPDKEAVRYEESDRVSLGMGAVETLNPIVSTDKDTYFISKLLYRGLFALDQTLTARPDLAGTYQFDPESATLQISLKNGVRWSDGQPVTGADVKFSFEAFRQASYSGRTLYGSYVEKILSVSVSKSDKNTVVLRYGDAGDLSLESLVFPVLPAHQFRGVKDALKENQSGFLPVGSGPYRAESYKQGDALTLTPNPHYAGGGSAPAAKNTLIFKVLPDQKSALALVEPNLNAMAFSEGIQRDVDFASYKARTLSYPSSEAEFLAFNFKNPALAQKKVRQAVASAADVKKILESAYFGSAVASDSLYYPGYCGVENKGVLFPYDLKKAEELLSSAGYADANGDGVAEDRLGTPLELRLLTDGDPSRKVSAETLAGDLQKLGIRVKIENREKEAFRGAVAAGDFDLYLGGYRFNERYDLRPILHSGRNPGAGYKNPELDEALDRMASAVFPEEKADAYRTVKEILKEEIPFYPIGYKTYGVLYSDLLAGVPSPMFNHRYRGAEQWKSKYELPREPEEDESAFSPEGE